MPAGGGRRGVRCCSTGLSESASQVLTGRPFLSKSPAPRTDSAPPSASAAPAPTPPAPSACAQQITARTARTAGQGSVLHPPVPDKCLAAEERRGSYGSSSSAAQQSDSTGNMQARLCAACKRQMRCACIQLPAPHRLHLRLFMPAPSGLRTCCVILVVLRPASTTKRLHARKTVLPYLDAKARACARVSLAALASSTLTMSSLSLISLFRSLTDFLPPPPPPPPVPAIAPASRLARSCAEPAAALRWMTCCSAAREILCRAAAAGCAG